MKPHGNKLFGIDSRCCDSAMTTGIVRVHKRRSVASTLVTAMWPTKNALMSGKGQGRKQHYAGDHYVGMRSCLCSPLSWPFDPRLQRLTVYFGPSSRLHCCCLTQARDSESESNYRDNYDRDPSRPGFVFKWTHLPWAFGDASAEARVWTRRLLCHPGSLSIIIDEHAY